MKASKIKKHKFLKWDNFDDSGNIKASHVYKHPKLFSYVSKYSKPNDYHVIDRSLTWYLDNCGVDYTYQPASVYEPQQLFDALSAFGKQIDEGRFFNDKHMKTAIARSFNVFAFKEKFGKLDVTEDEDSIRKLIKGEKSGGSWFSSKDESWDEAWIHSRKVLAGKAWFKPAVAFYRTQAGDKTRLVWGVPTDAIIIQGMFAPQIIERFKQLDVITLGDRRYHLGALTGSIANRRKFLYGLDFSKFDSTIPAFMIKESFKILRTWFGSFTTEQQTAWNLMVENFLHQSIVMPDGYIYTGKRRGIGSGEWLTNIVGSICNFMAITYATSVVGHTVYSENILVHGDDSYFGLDVELDLNKLASIFARLGMKLNPAKSEVGNYHKPIKYLGFYWKHGRGYRDFDELLTSAIGPEKYPDKSQYDDVNDWITDRILLIVSLSHDGVQQAEERGFGAHFDFDREFVGNMRMNYTKGVSSYTDYYNEYVIGERKPKRPFTLDQARFG